MKWCVYIFLIALTSSAAHAKDAFACMYRGNVAGNGIFTFEIYRAADFDKDTQFRLCEIAGKASLLVKAKAGKSFKVRTIDLDTEQLAKLRDLYEKSLGANFKDDTIGTDGSSWCLEANRMNYLKACFWSPGINTRTRGIEDFMALGTALWDLGQFDGSNGKLY